MVEISENLYGNLQEDWRDDIYKLDGIQAEGRQQSLVVAGLNMRNVSLSIFEIDLVSKGYKKKS